jgi:DNA mismatch repair protein MutS
MMDTLVEPKTTPMMAQWQECKLEAKEALLLFRLGDFYEAFYEDALVLSKELDLTLTKRVDVPMSGIPFHASDSYVDKLLEKGFKVAIAEQMEDPKVAKGIVKRQVVRILTPGTLVQSTLLKDKCPNYVGAIQKLNSIFGLAMLDVSTGDFFAMQMESLEALQDELSILQPKELLIGAKCFAEVAFDCLCIKIEEWKFEHKSSFNALTKHFKVQTLDGFGLKGMPACINAAAALLNYVNQELSLPIQHIETIRIKTTQEHLNIDRATLKHLEIVEPAHENSPSLLSHLDRTNTPMGGRMLRDWLLHPLLSPTLIRQRQETVSELMNFDLLSQLTKVRDLERLIMKIASGIGNPREVLSLKHSLEATLALKQLLRSASSSLLREQRDNLFDLSPLTEKIGATLAEEPPLRLSDGDVIRQGADQELDDLKKLRSSGHEWIAEYQKTLRERTGIKTLKVGYTHAFGYFIEVSRGQADRMPSDFTRKQTLVNSERFISHALKEYEQKIYSADEKIRLLESQIFSQLKEECLAKSTEIRQIAKAIGCIDVLFGFAMVAKKHRYIRPNIDAQDILFIKAGRHPTIETCLPLGEFVPNDVEFSEKERLHLISGPNMAGKSTFIRQVALLVIMAQTGSFIPAESAHIGVVDKVFSRIGASDDLSRGQSTFMVEMSETANILRHATPKSLVILDEIGRGTSTYDGIAIAWAVAEYLLTSEFKAKTLFATHYWELHAMEDKIPGAANFQVSIAETSDGIVFLHKIAAGKADKSYGIHVAKLAGIPANVIRKAEEILSSLETAPKKRPAQNQKQLDLFGGNPSQDSAVEFVLAQIRKCDIDHLTPLDALKILAEWKKRLT